MKRQSVVKCWQDKKKQLKNHFNELTGVIFWNLYDKQYIYSVVYF